MKPTCITYTCLICGEGFCVDVHFADPGGHKEQAGYEYPAKKAFADPDKCPECGASVDVTEAVEQAADQLNDQEEV